jgi:hypothetical protein
MSEKNGHLLGLATFSNIRQHLATLDKRYTYIVRIIFGEYVFFQYFNPKVLKMS